MLSQLLTKIFFIQTVSAKGPGNPFDFDITLYNPIGDGQTLTTLLNKFFTGLLWVSAFIAPIFIIYGAFQMLTSAGNAEKFGAGKKTILYTVIGFIIILAAKGIVDIISTALTIK
jgi:hypothetical protein